MTAIVVDPLAHDIEPAKDRRGTRLVADTTQQLRRSLSIDEHDRRQPLAGPSVTHTHTVRTPANL
jgi:hypothetical protein